MFCPPGPRASNASCESCGPTDVARSGKSNCFLPDGFASRPWVVPERGSATTVNIG